MKNSEKQENNKEVKITREWSMPNSNTFSIPPINKMIKKYAKGKIIDPFANNSKLATITNDLDSQYDTDYHMDALDFLKMFDDKSVDTVLYDPPYCYDGETDLFTNKGWKNIKNITKKDVIATLNCETNQLEWHKPEEVIKKKYHGNMVYIDNSNINLLITPNHRCYVRNALYKRYFWTEAKRLFSDVNEHWFKRTCEWEGKRINSFYFPKNNNTIPMDVWLKFLGLYLGMGEYEKKTENVKKPLVFIQEKYQETQKIILDVFDELGFEYDFDGEFIAISNTSLWDYVQRFGTSEKDRYVPDEFKNLPTPQLKALLDYLMIGCEHIRHKVVKANNNTETKSNSYYTYSERMMNDFCEVAIKCGCAINVIQEKDKNSSIRYEVQFLDNKDVCVKSEDCDKEVEFNDYIYCVTVPNSTLLVKRNGKVCWCGNSPRQVSECYKNLGKTVNMQTTQSSYWSEQKKEIGRIVKDDGVVITCSWNSGGIGQKYGFEQEEIMLVPHGGWHNDTIVVVEKKVK